MSLYILSRDFSEYKESKESTENLIEDTIEQESNNVDEINIDWEKLMKVNKDIVGWIKINDTNINYPILKDNSELKYLKHSYNGDYNINGSIFTLNNNPFQENETVIYGHNMKTGLMFSDLGKYLNKNFLYQHINFKIYSKNVNYNATVFSVYSTDIEKEESNTKLLNFQEKINYYKSKSQYIIENEDEINKIVKLSTCSYINNTVTPTNKRYYIIANLEEIKK